LRVTARFAMLVARSAEAASCGAHYSTPLGFVEFSFPDGESRSTRGEKTSVTRTDCPAKSNCERRAQSALVAPSASCRAANAGMNNACRRSRRLNFIVPRSKPGCAKSKAPSERLPRRASQRLSGPRGRWGSTVCAKTTIWPSQDKATSRTQARAWHGNPSASASSAVGLSRPWRSTRTAKRPRAWMRAVSEPRSRNHGIKDTLSGARNKLLRQGRSAVTLTCRSRRTPAA